MDTSLWLALRLRWMQRNESDHPSLDHAYAERIAFLTRLAEQDDIGPTESPLNQEREPCKF